MANYTITYKAATALQPDQVRAGGVEVMLGEGMLVFGPTLDEGTYSRPASIPLRFIELVVETNTRTVVYDAREQA